MRKLMLQPEQILVPGEYELGDEAILKIYFQIFEKGHGEDMPPVVGCSSTHVPTPERQEFYTKKIRSAVDWLKHQFLRSSMPNYDVTDSIDSLLGKLERAKSGAIGLNICRVEDVMRDVNFYVQRTQAFERRISEAGYFLLDGNHRSAAAALTNRPISLLELEKDEDINKVQQMIERGELFSFKQSEASIRNLYFSFVDWIVGEEASFAGGHLGHFKTVQERIDELTRNGHLPPYMKERYQQK